MISGILPIKKPSGVRSAHCVALVKKLMGKKVKVGHAGTLDGPASGLLILMIGRATRLCPYVMALPKVYEVDLQFGVTTTTDDATGEIKSCLSSEALNEREVDINLLRFTGVRMQIPPSISAVKVDGKRAHVIARDGETPEIRPRPVMITSIEKLAPLTPEKELSLRVCCHKGTYIRSIVRDLGNLAGCGAYMKRLSRIAIGHFREEDGIPFDMLSILTGKDLQGMLAPLESIFRHYTTYALTEEQEYSIRNGVDIPLSSLYNRWRGTIPETFAVALIGSTVLSFSSLIIKQDCFFVRPVTNIFYS